MITALEIQRTRSLIADRDLISSPAATSDLDRFEAHDLHGSFRSLASAHTRHTNRPYIAWVPLGMGIVVDSLLLRSGAAGGDVPAAPRTRSGTWAVSRAPHLQPRPDGQRRARSCDRRNCAAARGPASNRPDQATRAASATGTWHGGCEQAARVRAQHASSSAKANR